MANDTIKRVNISTRTPITALDIPIRGNVRGLNLTIKQILRVICQKGQVDEILNDGSVLRLDLSNYDKDNNVTLKNEVVVQAPLKLEPVNIQSIINPGAVQETSRDIEQDPIPTDVVETTEEAAQVEADTLEGGEQVSPVEVAQVEADTLEGGEQVSTVEVQQPEPTKDPKSEKPKTSTSKKDRESRKTGRNK